MTAAEQQPTSDRRRVLQASCSVHQGALGFANVVVRQRGGLIELDCHLDGSCVLTLDEDGATQLRDVLIEWLG
ncbi:MAG TPA: hypothetical protein VGL46_01650 [Pseudonocardiaceae bacterium]